MDVHSINTRLFAYYRSIGISIYDIHDINKGYCFNWAMLAYRTYGGKLCTVTNYSGHAFIKLKGKYYDSETPKGVKNWRLLKAYKGDQKKDVLKAKVKDMKITNEVYFIKHWEQEGKYTFVDIMKLNY